MIQSNTDSITIIDDATGEVKAKVYNDDGGRIELYSSPGENISVLTGIIKFHNNNQSLELVCPSQITGSRVIALPDRSGEVAVIPQHGMNPIADPTDAASTQAAVIELLAKLRAAGLLQL